MDNTKSQSDLIFDVGMHRGEDTTYYLKKGFRVIGFEADPSLAQHCRELFNKDIIDDRLVIVEGAILSPDENGQLPDSIEFYQNSGHTVWGTVVTSWADRNLSLIHI